MSCRSVLYRPCHVAEYEHAIQCYSEALEKYPVDCVHERSVAHGNRAACWVKLNEHEKSIEDCTKGELLVSWYGPGVCRHALLLVWTSFSLHCVCVGVWVWVCGSVGVCGSVCVMCVCGVCVRDLWVVVGGLVYCVAHCICEHAALEFNSEYVKVLLRRAQSYEATDKLESALEGESLASHMFLPVLMSAS